MQRSVKYTQKLILMNSLRTEVSSYKLLLILFTNHLGMEKQYGWFKSLCIIAMCFTELSGNVNSLCLNLFVG